MISGEILDIAKDFTALMIIADFDNIFGTFEGSNELPKLILNEDEYDSLFTVEKTSSVPLLFTLSPKAPCYV